MAGTGRAEGAGSSAPAALVEVPCAVCGSERRRRLFDKHGFTIVRCRDCGLAYVSPRPTDTVRIYQDENYYRNENACAFGYGDYEADRELREPMFDVRLAEIERHRPAKGRLLDVGCATGVLLQKAAEHGWDATGLDVSAFAIARCRALGLRVHHGDVASARLPAASFDVVVMDDTIEHVADPRRSLQAIHALLAPGGLLTMNTPNVSGRLHRLMGRHWFHFKPKEHLHYFDAGTLGRLLAETGFRVLDAHRSGKTVTFAYLCGRMHAYSPLAARLMEATLARLGAAQRRFVLPIGEFVVFAERT